MRSPVSSRRSPRRGHDADLEDRIDALGWDTLGDQLSHQGYACAGAVLTPGECAEIASWYDDDAWFRKRIVMERHNFGIGDYAYFAAPLPPVVSALRELLYARLSPVANAWARALGRGDRYPAKLPAYLRACHRAGQTKPTPLVLRYDAGGFNCLHRDMYGALYFPMQALVLLSRRGADFDGGQVLLVENRARQQARGNAIDLEQGEMLIFASNEFPAQGRRGVVRASMRHGVSPITRGRRFTLGVIFHDAA